MPTLRPGDRAPDVTLPAADRDGVVALTDYRGKQPVLLALYRSLYCPLCRRQMSQLALSVERLERSGVATLAVVATASERARLYYRFRPPRFRVAANPDLRTHRAYGLPHLPKTPAILQIIEAAAVEMARDLGSRPCRARRATRSCASMDSSRSRAIGTMRNETKR